MGQEKGVQGLSVQEGRGRRPGSSRLTHEDSWRNEFERGQGARE